MDVSSIITQVRDPPVVETVDLDSQCAPITENTQLRSDSEAAENDETNRNAERLSVAVEPAESNAREKRRGGGGGGGSRLLRQILCCFGLGGGHARGECHSGHYRNGQTQQPDLLGPQEPSVAERICAVIDLDETLVHSSFKEVKDPDFTVNVEIEGYVHQVYVLKRPFVDEFLEKMSQMYECVLFTASLAKYADPVSDQLDKWNAFKYRLFRESCVFHNDNYVKDLGLLGRPVEKCVIIDNSPASYMFNKENAIQVKSWLGDKDDTELRDLLPYLQELAKSDSVIQHLKENPPPCQGFDHVLAIQ